MYGFIVLAVYACIMIGATLLLSEKEKSVEGFFVADRKMGVFKSGMSIAATWIWAPALFVSAEKAYSNGVVGLFWFMVPNVLCLLLFIPFAKRIREYMPNGITLAGFMKNTYQSNKVKNVYLFQLVTLCILSTAVQLLAGGKILSLITGMPFYLTIVMLAAIALSYSWISGIRASVITDVVQMVFILIACLIFVPWASANSGYTAIWKGIGGISDAYADFFSHNALEIFITFGLPTTIGLISGPFGDQCFWQRAFSINKIGKAFFIGAMLFAIVPLSMGILGFIAAGTGFIPNDKSIVNLELVTHMLPEWVVFPFLFMLISGLLSTVDSNLCAISSLTTDIVENTNLSIAKASMLFLLSVAILIANIPGISVLYLFLIYGALRSTTLLPTIMTLLNKKLSADGICHGIIIALLIGVPTFAYGTINSSPLYATMGSLVSLLIPAVLALGWCGYAG